MAGKSFAALKSCCAGAAAHDIRALHYVLCMKAFYQVAANSLLTTLGNFFLWFALVFWVYLETHSVLASSIIGGSYMVIATLSGFWFGGIVDHHKKKSRRASFPVGLRLFSSWLRVSFTGPLPPMRSQGPTVSGSGRSWLPCFSASSRSNLRTIALPITVTILVPEDRRDRANGVGGMIMGHTPRPVRVSPPALALAYLSLLHIVGRAGSSPF